MDDKKRMKRKKENVGNIEIDYRRIVCGYVCVCECACQRYYSVEISFTFRDNAFQLRIIASVFASREVR